MKSVKKKKIELMNIQVLLAKMIYNCSCKIRC